MRRFRLALLVATTLAFSGIATVPGTPASADPCEPPAPAPLSFKAPVFIDQHRSGGEPTSVVAHDGSIIVGTHSSTTLFNPRTVPDPDFLTDYKNQTYVFRSTDDGATWSRQEVLPGMHTPSSTGLSDPDFTIDAAGNLYGTEINLVNVSVFSSSDNGKTWPYGNAISDSGDRPWLAARKNGEVYLRITGNLQKSLDGGHTWTTLTDPDAYGKIYVDPTDPKGLYAGSGNGVGVEVSRDDGHTWDSYKIPGASNNSVMDSVGVDKQGWVYYGYAQSGAVKFSSFDPSTNTWAAPVTIPRIGTGTPLWTWTVAGDDGRAAVGWYETTPVAGQSGVFDLSAYVAVTENARGSTVACADGSTLNVAPQFSVADAIGRPIHRGAKPCNGTGCNVTGDRRLGDFFTINYDQDGKVFITTGDTTILGPGGQVDTISHPLFAVATDDSPKLLAGPPAAPDIAVLADGNAGRDLLPATGNRCTDAARPTTTCEQPDTTIEPSIAVNPANPLNAVAVYQEGRLDGGGAGDNGWATTFDGGKTWTYGDFPGLTRETGGAFDRASDAVVAFGPDNIVYANQLVFDDVTGDALRSGLAVNVSHDGGATWGAPVLLQDDQGAGLNDKNWIVVDNSNATGHHFGRVYVVWDRVAPVLVNYSDDQGKTWLPEPSVIYPGQGIGSMPLVLPNGDLAVVFDTLAYALPSLPTDPEGLQGQLSDLSDRLVISVAHGAGLVPSGSPLAFAAPTTVATYDGNTISNQRAGTLPSAAVDPVNGRIYVAWESGRYRTDDVNDVVVTASDDGGVTWGPIVRVNTGPKDDGVDHYNAMVDVGTDGVVRVGYRQRDGSDPIDTFFQQSDDHGLHFTDPLLVNTVVRTDPRWGAYSRTGLFSGDYNQLAAAGSWTYIVRCESYNPDALEESRLSNRYHQTTWVSVVGPAGSTSP